MPTLFDLLEEHQNSRQNHKKDKRVFGLVLPGGAMRGAYSAGAMIPLIINDLADTFEYVVGSSAGAINGAYFVDHYANTISAYINDLTTKDFVNLMRREKKVDVDYAIDKVMKGKHPLNLEHLSHSQTQLHIVVTDAQTGKKVLLSDHQLFKQVYEELRASAALPLLYDKPVLIAGRYYIDGSVADAIPVDVAIKLGCTDILVIMNQQLRNYHFDKRHRRLERHLVRLFAKNQPEAIRNILPTDEKLLQINVRRLLKPHRKVRIYILEPSDEEMLVSLGSIDKPKIEKLAKLGIADMSIMLNKEIVQKIR